MTFSFFALLHMFSQTMIAAIPPALFIANVRLSLSFDYYRLSVYNI